MENTTQDALLVTEQDAPKIPPTVAPLPPAKPRLRLADRSQVLLRPLSLEETLAPDHPARIIWALVCRWDLTLFLATVVARGEKPGRPATDPRILISLWLYAYTQGVSNGRELDRLCESDDAYRWICGGVSLNYHTINDFRVDHEKAIDDLLTQMIARACWSRTQQFQDSRDARRALERGACPCGGTQAASRRSDHLGPAAQGDRARRSRASGAFGKGN
jgi:transposase